MLVERIKTPRIAICVEWRPLSQVIGPTSYGCFLFHQIICQWYWWITRAPAEQPTEISIQGMYVTYPATFETPLPRLLQGRRGERRAAGRRGHGQARHQGAHRG